jgi:hypothetical protein
MSESIKIGDEFNSKAEIRNALLLISKAESWLTKSITASKNGLCWDAIVPQTALSDYTLKQTNGAVILHSNEYAGQQKLIWSTPRPPLTKVHLSAPLCWD